jgi:hypothetical protein
MKILFLSAATAAVAILASAAVAEPYVDWTPQKGVWHVTIVKVDPNHIDDYLVGLKKTWAPGEEISKKHGLIDAYSVQVKMNSSDGGGNVLLLEHIPNMGLLEPDQARDQAMEKEAYAVLSKDKTDAQVRDFDKYRTFIADEYWNDVTFTK